MYPRLSEDICGLIGNDFHYTMVTVTNCTGRFGNKVTEDNLWMPYYEYERSIASAVHWEAICLFPDRPQQEHHQALLEKATPRDAIQDQQENIRRPSNLVLCRLVCWNVVGRWLVGDLRFFFSSCRNVIHVFGTNYWYFENRMEEVSQCKYGTLYVVKHQ